MSHRRRHGDGVDRAAGLLGLARAAVLVDDTGKAKKTYEDFVAF